MTNQNKTGQATVVQLDPPRFENGEAMLVAGLRGHFTTATWADIPAQWERLGSYGKIPGKVGVAHFGVCFLSPNGIDYLCGAEVAGVAGLAREFSHVSIPAQKYAVFAHHEHVSKLRDTMEAIQRSWFPRSGHEIARPADGAPDFFERYGEGFDPRTGMGDIEVWIPFKS
jgi:AraC family transcriptional regulator